MRLILLPLIFIQYKFAVAQSNVEIALGDDLQLIKVCENVYVHRSYKAYPMGRFGSNGLVYVEDDKAIMIDTPVTDSLTALLINWFGSRGITFTAAIPAHWHDDCLGGLKTVHAAGIYSYGLNATIELAKQNNYIPPQIGFNDSLIVKLYKKKIVCNYLGAGHTIDNIVIWIPDEKILFGGCTVKALSARGLGNTADADLAEWPRTILKIKETYPEANIIVPGHGTPGGFELLDYTHELLVSD